MKQDELYLRHILDEIIYLNSKLEFLTFEKFIDDETLKRSFVRSIEIMGEAPKNISEELKIKTDEIEWKKLAGMRDKLIHHYFGVDYYIVWDFIKSKIEIIKAIIEKSL